MNDVIDLVVHVQNQLVEMSAEGKHPADMNAYRYGLFSGMEFGIRSLEAGLPYIETVGMTLADWTLEIPQVLRIANKVMPIEHLFTAEQFVHPGYRKTASFKHYAGGIKTGFAYAYEMFEAMVDERSQRRTFVNLTRDRLTQIRREIESL